ncbi:MAG: NAD-dependent epimerase/dehydratase family protein [Rhodanobacter sp.]
MFESIRRVLVTGGTGFIGKRLIRWLVDNKGVTVIALGRRPCAGAGIESIIAPELDLSAISQALQGVSFDAVIHLAAAGVHPSDRDLRDLISINTLLPAQIVQLAQDHGARAVVIAGSSAEYLPPQGSEALSENATLEYRKLYGASKAAGGLLALAAANQLCIPAANLRIFNAYGPGEAQHRLLPSLVTQLQRGQRAELSAGKQIRDFIHVDDVCSGLWKITLALLDGRITTGAFNLCTGEGHSVETFARNVADIMHVPQHLLAFGALPLRADDTPYLVGDPSSLRAQAGWHPVLSFEHGLRDAVEQSRHSINVD